METCGILAGSLSADDAVFTITTLIIPKQKGTSDTVEVRGLRGGRGGRACMGPCLGRPQPTSEDSHVILCSG